MTLCSPPNSPDDSNHIVTSQQTSHPTSPSIDLFRSQLRVCYIPFFIKSEDFTWKDLLTMSNEIHRYNTRNATKGNYCRTGLKRTLGEGHAMVSVIYLCPAERKLNKLSWKFSNSYFQELEQKYGNKFHLTEEIPLNPFFKRKIGRFLLDALLGRDEYVVVDMLIQRQPLKKISGTRLTNSTFLSKSLRRHTYVVSLSLHH